MSHASFFRSNAAGVPAPRGLYDPANEHDACGVGFVARINAEPRHDIVTQGVQVLINLEHRGALGGDKATGDGAGIMMRVPHAFLEKECAKAGLALPEAGGYAVGMVFLPTVPASASRCEDALARIASAEKCPLIGWRTVPVDPSTLGALSRSTLPLIRQCFIKNPGLDTLAFERKLYVIRRLVEKEAARWDNADVSQFYLTSLSSRTIVYKGLLTGSQLAVFYPDLADESFVSPFAVIHQRYSTNTLPTWHLAHPFRMLAHNGEINTLHGNINRMKAREASLASDLFGNDLEKIKPVLIESGSDSAIFDNALELLTLAGRELPHAMMMMVPEAWGKKYHMSADKRAFYEYHATFMEPWDGPAAVVFCDGRYIGGTLDRNGLRPARYTITRDGLIVLASETGVLDFPADQIIRRGRLQPGKMLLIDLEEKRIVPDNEIKAKIARQRPYRHWVKEQRIDLRGLFVPPNIPAEDPDVLLRKQHVFGYTEEDLKIILTPMATTGQEPVGSMGDDSALAVLSNRPQLLFRYFKQLFAQVTNPPIDPLREELVMSLNTFIGREKNLLEETPEHCRMLRIPHPMLTPEDMIRLRTGQAPDIVTRDLDMLFPAGGDGRVLRDALQTLFVQAERHILDGATVLVLTDRNVDADHAPIPSLLAAAGLHHHLIRRGLRTRAAIVVESGEPREVMHFALLLGFGTNAICPNVAFSTIRDLAESGLLEKSMTPGEAVDKYFTAVKKGLLKTFSRMGISTLRSFFGSQIFEAVGLSEEVIDGYFCGAASRISGIGLDEITVESNTRHRRGFPLRGRPAKLLDVGGSYNLRVGGEKHLWTPDTIYKLQAATREGDYGQFKEYTGLINDQSRDRATLRSLFSFTPGDGPIPIGEVESVEKILPRFVTAAMSLGSISKETHETIAIALNRLGGRSNSGEGGEDPVRNKPLPNGDSKRSRIRQVASARFGVTTEYLVNADEIQIKMAQGAKPGEGGQLPGHKVSPEIARVRHTTPWVTLISPPPHHDIYSIEDLAQLIFDLKSVNPAADVSVKLVSEVGVGTIATGVSKAKADLVLISGHDGGTGASPLTSIKSAGLPWELGLAETQQALVGNQLRDRIRVQVDGQLKTGRDLAIAALMGAEEFGFGTTVLVTLGCIMMRKCHLNTCPVGVATQDPELRARFTGKPEFVVNFFRFMAQELREHMAQLGFRTIDEMVGRVDRLEVLPAIEHWKARGLDFSRVLLPSGNGNGQSLRCIKKQEHDVMKGINAELIRQAKPALDDKTPVKITMPIRNVHRTACTMLAGEVAKRYGLSGLPDGTIDIDFTGSAGQSMGAFLTNGISVRVTGDANDYLAKGMSGGRIVVTPPQGVGFDPSKNVVAGNVILYGATGGEVFLHGRAGERFAVRNSGAKAVVEGVGDHGCEYMTGGVVVVLGPTGNNFAAGMSGGVAYVYDETELFDTRCNLDMVDVESVWEETDVKRLRSMIEDHVKYTGSPRAKTILADWASRLPLFVKVMPIEYRKALERMRLEEYADNDNVAATEEVFRG
ncbi:MAG TPA: glutamate synthase large subunit [Candidatus Deferrimicrobiaceae bacterium]|jgi:glutamate synthase domain-containing protein 2/glutamate synthase domain-containing protein 1/glutamate synthase domain-containing protein 3